MLAIKKGDFMLPKQKLSKNKREQTVTEKYLSEGYEVLKKGWPDFLFIKENNIILVEVKRKQKKPSVAMGLSKHQRAMKDILSKYFEYIVEYVE